MKKFVNIEEIKKTEMAKVKGGLLINYKPPSWVGVIPIYTPIEINPIEINPGEIGGQYV